MSLDFEGKNPERIENEALENAGYLAGLNFVSGQENTPHNLIDPNQIEHWQKGYNRAIQENGFTVEQTEPNEEGMIEE